MTSHERESLRPECVKGATSQNLLDTRAAKELAIRHLFEHVSLKRELMLPECFFDGVGAGAASRSTCLGKIGSAVRST